MPTLSSNSIWDSAPASIACEDRPRLFEGDQPSAFECALLRAWCLRMR